jgi:hypothetical protein
MKNTLKRDEALKKALNVINSCTNLRQVYVAVQYLGLLVQKDILDGLDLRVLKSAFEFKRKEFRLGHQAWEGEWEDIINNNLWIYRQLQG